MGLIKMAAAGIAGYTLYKYATRDRDSRPAPAGNEHFTEVRDAGPENMKDKPARWSQTDEAIDESFPASDPPGTY
ncbi:hypothetical protein [Novosphingobium beihaiensis]|uniref:Uncharacterized protein n=1 Tax=Novosphingobium beihaiensis TaxID=2930389 RepID=A0ABT0BWB5_9SPHN|nr:hypothetical protein [Novosphingobium beihaiensis]MCJ2189183.1 hypothetical protein [Novosphingobium beihaiensis]